MPGLEFWSGSAGLFTRMKRSFWKGEIVDLRGRTKGQDGMTTRGAKGRVLVTDKL